MEKELRGPFLQGEFTVGHLRQLIDGLEDNVPVTFYPDTSADENYHKGLTVTCADVVKDDEKYFVFIDLDC